MSADLTALEGRLDVRFADRRLLQRALTHRSYAFENGLGLEETNERLEFLGDAVLSLAVTDELYRAYPQAAEGRLAKIRAAAVRASSLAAVARDLDLGRHVLLGKGESASGGADKDSILADTLEAVLGAVYLDGGYIAATDLILDLFGGVLDQIAGRGPALDYKTSLQELVADRFERLPRYEVTGSGPDHERTFTAVVHVDGREAGRGRGPSKKRAEQAAAREAYLNLSAEEDTPGASSAAGVV